MLDEARQAPAKPILAREPNKLPGELCRGGDVPDDLDPLADGVLMKHQADWIADDADLKLAEKGRRTGITFAEATDATLIAAAKSSAGGSNYFYIGDTKDKGREFIGYVAHFAKIMAQQIVEIEEFLFEDQQEDGSTKFISAFRVKFASGYRVEALSSNPANIRGLQGVVCIDEAAFHAKVREVLDAVTALLIWGGKVRVISTHNGVLNPFNELVKEALAGRISFSVHHIPFKAAIENGLYKRVCHIRGKVWTLESEIKWEGTIRKAYGTRTAAMRQELDAIPAESEGAALTGVQIENCQIEGVPRLVLSRDDDFRNQPELIREADVSQWCETHLLPVLKNLDTRLQHFFGQDFARSGDVSCFVVREIDGDIRRDKLVVEMSNVPFEQQKQVLWYVLNRLPRFGGGAMDASGNGAWLAEVTAQKYGECIHEIKPTQEWYRLEMPFYKAAFEDGTVEICDHDDIMLDHRALQYVNGIIKVPEDFRFKGSDGRKRHGDTAIAGALCWFATRQLIFGYGYESAAERNSNSNSSRHRADRDRRERSIDPDLRGSI